MIKNYFIIQFKENSQTYYIKDYHGDIHYNGPGCLKLNQAVEFTQSISDIKLLFNSFEEAFRFEYDLLSRHHLFTFHQDDLEIIPIKKFIFDGEDFARITIVGEDI